MSQIGEIASVIFPAPDGGVMTDTEAGTLTGDLILEIAITGSDEAEARVAYAETDDWYPVEGSPIPTRPGEAAQDLAMRVAAHLSEDKGADGAGNPRHTDLRDLPAA